MQIILDRKLCNPLQRTCEPCFAEHLRRNDFEAANCAVTVRQTKRPEISFKIYDRDASIKTLIVTDENRIQALKSWMTAWEEQAGPVI